jgi:hypothetical protein
MRNQRTVKSFPFFRKTIKMSHILFCEKTISKNSVQFSLIFSLVKNLENRKTIKKFIKNFQQHVKHIKSANTSIFVRLNYKKHVCFVSFQNCYWVQSLQHLM